MEESHARFSRVLTMRTCGKYPKGTTRAQPRVIQREEKSFPDQPSQPA
jgi:hypothetical protein